MDSSDIKVGDRVKIVARLPTNTTGCVKGWSQPGGNVGAEGYITGIHLNGTLRVTISNEGGGSSGYYGWFKPGEEIVKIPDHSSPKTATEIMMNTLSAGRHGFGDRDPTLDAMIAEWAPTAHPTIAVGRPNMNISKPTKENKPMTTKYYRLLKNTPYFNEGAILKNDADGDYISVEDYWYTEAAELAIRNDWEPHFGQYEVEESPEFFERIYEISKLGKMVYVTKEVAVKEATKFFKKEK